MAPFFTCVTCTNWRVLAPFAGVYVQCGLEPCVVVGCTTVGLVVLGQVVGAGEEIFTVKVDVGAAQSVGWVAVAVQLATIRSGPFVVPVLA